MLLFNTHLCIFYWPYGVPLCRTHLDTYRNMQRVFPCIFLPQNNGFFLKSLYFSILQLYLSQNMRLYPLRGDPERVKPRQHQRLNTNDPLPKDEQKTPMIQAFKSALL